MTTDRQKPGAAFWATVGLIVMVLYVLSIGPAYRIVETITGTDPFYAGSMWGNSDLLDTVYAPLKWAADTFPFAADAIWWYVVLWF